MLAADIRTCPNCLRVRTEEEIALGYAARSSEENERRNRPIKSYAIILAFIAAAVLLAETGKLAWDRRLTTRPAPIGSRLDAIDETLRPGAARAPQTSPARRALAQIPPPSSGEWRVYGEVHDIATLRPVSGAVITFTRGAHEIRITESDARGAYEMNLMNGAGWTVSLQSPNHRPGQILDVDPPYATRDSDERNAVISQISDDDLTPAAILRKSSSSPTRIDLYAVPAADRH